MGQGTRDLMTSFLSAKFIRRKIGGHCYCRAETSEGLPLADRLIAVP